jgi:Phosphotransferase enzyme family
MSTAIPHRLEDICASWLTAALRAHGVLEQAAVTACAIEPIGAGLGFLGQLARLRPTYDRPEPGAPASLVAKLPTVDPGGREICRLFQFYPREIAFYRELAREVELRVPRCYASAMDEGADEYAILLEDLGALRLGDDVAGCSAADAEATVGAVARLHGAWWQSPQLEKLDWMPNADAPVHQFAEPAYAACLAPFLQLFGDRLSRRMRAIAEAMQTHVLDLLNATAAPPRTIVHGDFRLDNLFFGPTAPAVIDWQIACRGRGIFDVAYFLSGSLDSTRRRAEEIRLVRLWHDIAASGRQPAYSFDDAFTDYRRSVLYCNVYTVIATSSLDPGNQRGMALFNAWLERRVTAIEELDAGDLMP